MANPCTYHGKVYLYNGPGAWTLSVRQTERMLHAHWNSHAVKTTTDFQAVDKDTSLVVVPGGSTVFISDALSRSVDNLRQYVGNGGNYLGICAGAIFATRQIHGRPFLSHVQTSIRKGSLLATDDLNTLCDVGVDYDEKDIFHALNLRLYQGRCVVPYVVQHERAANPLNFTRIDVLRKTADKVDPFRLMCYSGPVFPAVQPDATTLLSYGTSMQIKEIAKGDPYTYSGEGFQEEHPAAVIACSFGRGKAVLSGVHYEFDPMTFATDAVKESAAWSLPPDLIDDEKPRQALIQDVWDALSIK